MIAHRRDGRLNELTTNAAMLSIRKVIKVPCSHGDRSTVKIADTKAQIKNIRPMSDITMTPFPRISYLFGKVQTWVFWRSSNQLEVEFVVSRRHNPGNQ